MIIDQSILNFIINYVIDNFGGDISSLEVTTDHAYYVVRHKLFLSTVRYYFEFEEKCTDSDGVLSNDLILEREYNLIGNDKYFVFKKRPLSTGEVVLTEI